MVKNLRNYHYHFPFHTFNALNKEWMKFLLCGTLARLLVVQFYNFVSGSERRPLPDHA